MTLEQLRIRMGMTQDELAEKIGVNRATISAWENGTAPRVTYMRPLAEALGVTTTEIYDAIQATQARNKK